MLAKAQAAREGEQGEVLQKRERGLAAWRRKAQGRGMMV
jgi:hypothetical protein